MTGTSLQAASSSAAEVAGGNFSYGNVSLGNSQLGNVSQLQRNFNSSLGVGGHVLDTGGEQTRNDISGRSIITRAVSSGVTDVSGNYVNTEEVRKSWQDSLQQAQSEAESLQRSQSLASSQTQRIANTLSRSVSAGDLQKYGISNDKAEQLIDAARVVSSHHSGREYNQATHAGVSLGTGLGGFGPGLSGGVSATNTRNLGESSQESTSEDLSSSEKIVENAIKDISLSERNDELTQAARDHGKTLSEIEQHSRSKSYHEQQARNYQELLGQSESLNFSQRNNLLDSALEIAQQQGLSSKESFELLNSRRPEDQSARNEIFREAYAGSSSSRRGDSFMKQPSFARFDDGDSRRKEFQQNIQSTTNNPEFDQQTQQIKLDIEQEKQLIKAKVNDFQKPKIRKQSVQSQKIEKEVSERAAQGAAEAALNQLKDTWTGKK
jgi:hypothetical protein